MLLLLYCFIMHIEFFHHFSRHYHQVGWCEYKSCWSRDVNKPFTHAFRAKCPAITGHWHPTYPLSIPPETHNPKHIWHLYLRTPLSYFKWWNVCRSFATWLHYSVLYLLWCTAAWGRAINYQSVPEVQIKCQHYKMGMFGLGDIQVQHCTKEGLLVTEYREHKLAYYL